MGCSESTGAKEYNKPLLSRQNSSKALQSSDSSRNKQALTNAYRCLPRSDLNTNTSLAVLPPKYRSICCGCIETVQGKNFYRYNDDRVICEECRATAVFGRKDLSAIIEDVYNFYKTALDLDISDVGRYYRISLVEYGQVGSLGKICHTETSYQEVKSCIIDENEKKVTVEARKIHSRGILITYGLSKLLTGATLSALFMSAWLSLKGYRMRSIVSDDVQRATHRSMAYKFIEYGELSTTDSRQLYLMKKTKNFIEKEIEESFYLIKTLIDERGLKFVLRDLGTLFLSS